MMFTAAIVLTILAATSSVVDSRSHKYPKKSTSRGFHLVVNVTDSSRPLAKSPHGKLLSSIHIGPTHNLLGIGNGFNPRVFYHNATKNEFRSSNAQIFSGGGTSSIQYGLSLHLDEGNNNVSSVRLDVGDGQRGLSISQGRHPYAFLNLSRLAMCNEPIKYYHGKKMVILKQFNNPDMVHGNIPEECAPIHLLPQCVPFDPSRPAWGIPVHEFVREADCYKNVSAINWSRHTSLSWHE
ncbi:uncharacterized protein MAM_07786 [Metarhizium album ARSEF 1941]|uniref:DUF7907 domain-containing protein n=1 Tax=Metarhizium album (strain ARSEF 1941) TaxID=1081103 RepID=A0A0B2WLK1_METAS|nr:uncharacterized protein MAM_07786 [Metarhizium album ARSEF 1941]KHN94357.1 hypothetical protein MAM_07786 [Metarhizium album ARSEF 1941]